MAHYIHGALPPPSPSGPMGRELPPGPGDLRPPGYRPGNDPVNRSPDERKAAKAPGGSSGGKKKEPKEFTVGDPVHFAVQDGRGAGPTRHGSVVLFVDGDRALLASNSSVPNVKVIEVAGDKVGMSWVKTAYLGRGHKNCQTALSLSLDAAWGLRSKILLTAGEVNETIVLSGRGSASNTSQGSNNSGVQSPTNGTMSPGDYGDYRPHDHELRAMVAEALKSGAGAGGGTDSARGETSKGGTSTGYTESTQDGSTRPPPRQAQNHHMGPSGQVDPDMARDIRTEINQAFDEGIQAFRDEQKNMDRWVNLLQERVSKVTGNFLMSWGSRLEFEMDRRLSLYNDAIKTTCASLQEVQLGGHGSAVPNMSLPPGAGAKSLPRIVETSQWGDSDLKSPRGLPQSGKTAPRDPKGQSPDKDATPRSAISGFGNDSGGANEHTMVMIEKIRKDHARGAAYKQAIETIETSCACEKEGCIPKPFVAFVNSEGFNNVCAFVTLGFAVMVGVEVNMNIAAELGEDEYPAWIGSIITIFNLAYVLEVIVRMLAAGVDYFLGPEWRWNLFDLFLVALSISDVVKSTGTVGFMRVLRALKIVKALRVVRVFRLFRELRVMASQMKNSLATIFWSIVFLVVFAYLFAVIFLQAAIVYIKDTSRTNSVADDVRLLYSNLPDAMYSLICSITGGMDWKEVAAPVWHFGWLYGVGFMLFILVSVLGVLNVITSVFVEQATSLKRLDRDFAISEELGVMEKDIEETMSLFKKLDPECKSSMRVQDMNRFLQDERIIAHFATIGIDITDPANFAHLLQTPIADDAGMVSLSAFVLGCFSTRGAAKQSDTLSIVMAVRKLEHALHSMRGDIEAIRHGGGMSRRGGGASASSDAMMSPRSDAGMGLVPQESGAMSVHSVGRALEGVTQGHGIGSTDV